jgi:hypothetical protein
VSCPSPERWHVAGRPVSSLAHRLNARREKLVSRFGAETLPDCAQTLPDGLKKDEIKRHKMTRKDV